MKRILKIGCLLALALALSSCETGSSSSGGGGSSSGDYRFLYDHNATHLGGHTIRWESNTIKVYTGGIAGAEAAINRWVGPVNFSYVGSSPSDGISFSWTSSNSYCGITYTYYTNSGRISQAIVQIATNQALCRGGLDNTVSHEAAHALGFFGHTADGGLMDPDGGNSNITTPVRNFMSLLYSHPFGWDITPFLSLQGKLMSSLYQKNGTQILVRVEYR
jgi:hypothetical protein